MQSISTFMARTTLKAGLYKEALRFMNEGIAQNPALSREDLDLLSEILWRIAEPLRSAVRGLSEAVKSTSNQNLQIRLLSKKERLRKSLTAFCNQTTTLIENTLLPAAETSPARVFLFKTRGDYRRYLAEIASEEDYDYQVEQAKSSYESAMMNVNTEMSQADPINLGLILNYCVFLHEIQGAAEEAIDKAESAFNEAVRYLEELEGDQYNNTVLILELIRDNINLWRQELDDNAESTTNV